MNTSILFAVVCALTSVACDNSCLGECDDWSEECSGHHHSDGGRENAGGWSAGGNASGGRGIAGNESGGSASSGDSGGTASSTGKGGDPGPVPCAEESDCARGFNCDDQRKECVAAGAETCPELSLESDCDNRQDCIAIYAGVNCSCGPECACVGGEPGCVCQSFEFFACEPVKN